MWRWRNAAREALQCEAFGAGGGDNAESPVRAVDALPPPPILGGFLTLSRRSPMRIAPLPVSLAALLLGTSALGSSAWAQGKLRGTVRLGGDFGGDKVLQFQYSDGTTPDVSAGGGLLLSAGGALQAFQLGRGALDVQINVGIKYRTIPPASNQTATWSRYPVEGLVLYRAPVGLRVGGGVAYHLANVLEASGAVANDRVEFKTKPGVVLQTEYVRHRWAFDVRYTLMTYEVSSGGSGTVNANSIGAGFSYWFGGSAAGSAKGQ